MADSLPAPSQLILDDHPRLGRIHVDMEAFFDFSFWIAEELEDMKGPEGARRDPVGPQGRTSGPV